MRARRRGCPTCSGASRRTTASTIPLPTPTRQRERQRQNEVGCHRRNLFVPVSSFHDARAFNGRILGDSLDLSADKYHYRLCTPELELLGEDGEALSPCHRPRSRALGVRRGGTASRAYPRSAACTATWPVRPTCAARSPPSWAPSTLRSATPHPGMWSPLTSASGAMHPRTASIRRCSRAAVHAASGLEGLERQLLGTVQVRVLPGRGGSGGHRLRTQGAVRRDRRAGLARRSGGHVTLAAIGGVNRTPMAPSAVIVLVLGRAG